MTEIPFEYERIPPKNQDESPEEIRRQRDLYRDIVDHDILMLWKDVKPEDLDPNRPHVGIEDIIAELEAGLVRG
jgi:hypothetical protein